MNFGIQKYFWVLLMVVLIASCSPANYSAQDLERLQAKSVYGEITTQSRGSFSLTDKSGDKKTYRTGERTQYIPQNYRSQKDDSVRISFREIRESSGRVKLVVLQLESINIPEKNMAPGKPLKGVIVSVERGSTRHAKSFFLKVDSSENAYRVYIPTGSKANISVDGKPLDTVNSRWEELVGKKTEIKVVHAPILRGNGYIYETDEVNAVSEDALTN